MRLEEVSFENMTILLNELADCLQVANRALLDPEDYDLNKYSDLKLLHRVATAKDRISAMESQAFVDELATMRKK